MKRNIIFIAVAVLVLATVVGGWFGYRNDWFGLLGAPATGSGEAGGGTRERGNIVSALGRLEPEGGLISVGAPPGDSVAELPHVEGGMVKKGEMLFKLDSYNLYEYEVMQVESQKREAIEKLSAEASLGQARHKAAQIALKQAQNKETEIEQLTRQISLGESNLQLERNRLEALMQAAGEFVTPRQIEQQKLLITKLTNEIAAGRTQIEVANATKSLAVEAAQADLAAAQVALDLIVEQQRMLATETEGAVNIALKAAREKRDRAIIRAANDGVILKIFTHAGEQVANTPVLQMADISRMLCIAEVYENDVRRVHAREADGSYEGDDAVITSDAFEDADGKPRTLRGKVVQKGRLVGSPELKFLDPFKAADRHVVAVKIILTDPADIAYASHFINLQVDVEIEVK